MHHIAVDGIAQVFESIFLRFSGPAGGNTSRMPLWTLLSIPGTLILLVLVLYLTDVAETRIVSSRALILRAVVRRRTSPEQAEALVAAEVERLLRASQS